MNHKKKSFVFSSLILLQSFDIQSFCPWYFGSDAHESLNAWGEGRNRFEKESYIKDFPYFKHYVETIPLVDVSNVVMSDLPYPYNTLTSILPYENAGFYINFEAVAKLFSFNSIQNAIEVGSDFGRSTRNIASLLPTGGKLYAIDTWDFTNECQYDNTRYHPFLSNVVHTGLTDKIYPIKKPSQDAIEIFKLLRLTFDFIYLDGDHATEAVKRDLELYYPQLSATGIICGDDWLLKTVRTGIVQFAQKYNLTIYGACNFWFLKNEGGFAIKSFINADQSVWEFRS